MLNLHDVGDVVRRLRVLQLLADRLPVDVSARAHAERVHNTNLGHKVTSQVQVHRETYLYLRMEHL